jgi:hypothetical protein
MTTMTIRDYLDDLTGRHDYARHACTRCADLLDYAGPAGTHGPCPACGICMCCWGLGLIPIGPAPDNDAIRLDPCACIRTGGDPA